MFLVAALLGGASVTAGDEAVDAADAAQPVAAVLVVDDNAGKRLAMRAMLTPLGYAVVEAESGRDALHAVLRQTFAVILMDVRMPVMDGYETAKLIRQRSGSASTPIVFVTAFGLDEAETETAYASGGVDFIFTPIRAEVVRAKISAFVNVFLRAQDLERSLASITALNAALRDSEVRARVVLQNVADGIVTAGEQGLIESFNRSAQRLFGYREDELVGQPLQRLIAPSHHDAFSDPARAAWRLLTAKDIPAEPIDTVGCRKDGTTFAMEIGMSQVEIGERTFTIGCIRDISSRKAYTEALVHRVLHDDLTGLPNRTLFADRVDWAIESAYESRAVLVIDLDKFREVNDTRGHETGDAVLQAVAQRLRGAVRGADTVARLGGDEFGVLPFGEADVETAAVIAWKLRDAFEHPFVIGGQVIDVRASIGIAFFPQHGRATADLLRRADLALREAKRAGTGLAVFATEADDRIARRLTLLSELRDCIPRGELVVHYQPKIDLATRRTTAVEALVRWQHPADGLLMPARFMPEAERSELIEPLTRWVLDEALRQQRAWHDAGFDLSMAVNVSARSLGPSSDLPETVAKLTESWGIEPGRLILELTEGAMIDADDVLHVLHAMGERIAIDDFGTGHSSLAYLQRLPIDEIKVDRSFVTNLATSHGDAVIVRSTVELAHNLGLTVVAEGIEDEATLEVLAEYRCDQVQGYHFAHPRPAEELTAWLTESPYGAPKQNGH